VFLFVSAGNTVLSVRHISGKLESSAAYVGYVVGYRGYPQSL